MAITACAVTKSTSWRGGTEFFSNVYHYFSSTNLDVALATDLADFLIDAEKSVHTSQVTFEHARVWEAGGSPTENETLVIRDASGTGILGNSGGMFKEACVVTRIDTNRNTSTGRRIYLRKFYHSCGLPSASSDMYEGEVALTATQTGPFKTIVEQIREATLTGGIAVFLCAPGGQLVNDSRPVTVDPYLHTRQFRQ